MFGVLLLGRAALAAGVATALFVGAQPRTTPATDGARDAAVPIVQPKQGLDAGSVAQTGMLRHATSRLETEMRGAKQCDATAATPTYRACVQPALRHAGVAGAMTARMAGVTIKRVPYGRCRTNLLEVQAANAAAGEQARWALTSLYVGRPGTGQARVAAQVAGMWAMLRRAHLAAVPAQCAPQFDDGPAI
jgi:hypothetical protein